MTNIIRLFTFYLDIISLMWLKFSPCKLSYFSLSYVQEMSHSFDLRSSNRSLEVFKFQS